MNSSKLFGMVLIAATLAVTGCVSSKPPHLASSQKVSGHNGIDQPGEAGAGTADGPSGGS